MYEFKIIIQNKLTEDYYNYVFINKSQNGEKGLGLELIQKYGVQA